MAEASNNDQKRMSHSDTEKQSEKEHNFKFGFNSQVENYPVMCSSESMTVLEALNTNKSFRENDESSKKEMVIQRNDRAAIHSDFPCCLIEKDEILTITFIKNKEKDSPCIKNQEKDSPCIKNQEKDSPCIKNQEKDSPCIKNQEKDSPCIKNQEKDSPCIKNQEKDSPCIKNQEKDSPCIKNQEKDSPCIKNQEKDSPCIKNQEKDSPCIKNQENDSTEQQTNYSPLLDLVTFKIKTTGGDKIMYIMKNNELKKIADHVCVYAFKEEQVETALKRDGRFIDKIFQKQCVLSEIHDKLNQTTICEMSQTVNYLDKKLFQIKKKKKVKMETDVASNTSVSAQNEPRQHPVSTEQKQTLQNPESSLSAKWPTLRHSNEILKSLRVQFEYLLKNLNETEVQKFFRAEYDKSAASFSEVYKIKQLMRLSDSVCQIRVDGFARGTGFLLFGQYILTNAHVIWEFLESPDKLSSTKSLEAAFDFERLDLKLEAVKLVQVKKQIAAYCYITDPNNRHLDFALLELDAVDEITGRPELLSCFSPGPPPSHGGICIVGHPEGGIKKMDPCFIIGKDKTQEAADKHVSENRDFIHVITQRSLEDRWDIYENQINYDSCFFHGSSGSPVFDEHCYLIGVHTGGYVYPEEGKTRSVIEYGYSMQSILEMIRAQARIRGSHDIVNILEAYTYKSNEYGTADQENQTDYEMEDAE